MIDDTNRLQFIGVDTHTRQTLKRFKEIVSDEIEPILKRFYGNIRKFPDAWRFIGHDTKVPSLIDAQKKHWLQLFEAEFDDGYFASVRRVGLAHVRIGLEPNWYLGAYGYILPMLHRVIFDAHRRKPKLAMDMIEAVDRAVMLDAEASVTVYLDVARSEYDRKMEGVLAAFDEQMTSIVEEVVGEAANARGLAEKISSMAGATKVQTESVSSGAEEVSGNTQSIASATEQLSHSIREVSQQIHRMSDVAESAVAQVEAGTTHGETLTGAISRIGEVLNLIQGIAKQTNLLALNATIEAQRAGEAGRGFAVVASEVKTLARQTAEATSSIDQSIGSVRGSTEAVVSALGAIQQVVTTTRETASAVSAVVEQQSAATDGIARNVDHTANGSSMVSRNVISLDQQADATASAASKLKTSATALDTTAANLRQAAASFAASIQEQRRAG